MSAALAAPVLLVEQLRAPADRFRCEPYRVVLAADACVKRQQLAADPPTASDRMRVEKCAACALGAQVRARVGDAVRAPVAASGKRGRRPGQLAAPLAGPSLVDVQRTRAAAHDADLLERLAAGDSRVAPAEPEPPPADEDVAPSAPAEPTPVANAAAPDGTAGGSDASIVAEATVDECAPAAPGSAPASATTAVAQLAARVGMSAREREVLEHTLAGVPRSRLAAALGCGESTAKTHVRGLLFRTGHPDLPALALAVLRGDPAPPPANNAGPFVGLVCPEDGCGAPGRTSEREDLHGRCRRHQQRLLQRESHRRARARATAADPPPPAPPEELVSTPAPPAAPPSAPRDLRALSLGEAIAHLDELAEAWALVQAMGLPFARALVRALQEQRAAAKASGA